MISYFSFNFDRKSTYYLLHCCNVLGTRGWFSHFEERDYFSSAIDTNYSNYQQKYNLTKAVDFEKTL